jgi:predicted nucleic acid-binding Zn ribbon protein
MKTCEFCSKNFLAEGRSDQKYCSHNCGKRAWGKKQAELKKTQIETAKCEFCNGDMKVVRNDRRFCSDQCKTEWHKERKRDANEDKHKNNPKTCDHGHKEFIPNRPENERFCSKSCKIDFHRVEAIKQREERRANTKKVCPTCGKEFKPKVTLKEKYCSKRCREIIGKKIYKMMQTCYNAIGTQKADRSHKVLGYTPNQLLKHIQTFPQWGKLKKKSWHLDHKFPIIAFVENNINDISLICCLENLQPLAGKENCSKNGTYDQAAFEEWLSN